uniref:Palmitoyl-protein thioesterase 1 n=1 Tax=Panagrolaimus sp. PS1159 TaxID=55785 RepID=A0AC35ETZ1_9BILA
MKAVTFGFFVFTFLCYFRSFITSEEIDNPLNNNETIPTVLWHGMGDSCCNPLSMGRIKKLIESEINGIYVHSLKLGGNIASDMEHGYLGNMNKLVTEACAIIRYDPKLKNGYNAVGFSQAGLFFRAVAQRCPVPPIKNLISIGGPQQGIFGFPYCPGSTTLCNWVRYALDMGAYLTYVQNRIVQAQYWHDPYQADDYKDKNIFLADLNNEKTQNDEYKKNLQKLENLVLVKFARDQMVVPRESEWFGFYPDENTTVVLDMKQTKLYKEDRIGLKGLKEAGKLKFIAIDGDHLRISNEDFIEKIVKPYLA